jgi:hypothetical protein
LLHVSGGGAFLIEVVVTAALVLVVLGATRRIGGSVAPGVYAGFALAIANILAIPIDGGSVNPARSFGPAVVVGGLPLSQLWLFLVAPLVGGVIAAAVFLPFSQISEAAGARAQPAMTMAGAEEGVPEAAPGRVTTTPEMPPGTQRVVSGGTTEGGRQAGQGPAMGGQPPPEAPGRGASASPPPGGIKLKQPAAASRGGEKIG